MTPALFERLVAKAAHAPSVHNVQPARWQLRGDQVALLCDGAARLPAADPTGHDVEMSLGAACEGFVLAASQEGLNVTLSEPQDGSDAIKLLHCESGATEDPLAAHVETRQSWRGAFRPASPDDRKAAEALSATDCAVITDSAALRDFADLVDQASFPFLADDDFRRELLSYMRLRKSHPRWQLDGMNADAMHLGLFEAMGAGFVMGSGFRLLNRFGLAEKLLSDADKTTTATGIVLVHRPQGEAPFDSGRTFYRAWLRCEAAGFPACVLAALADDKEVAKTACAKAGIPKTRQLISAFRIGRPLADRTVSRARLPIKELII